MFVFLSIRNKLRVHFNAFNTEFMINATPIRPLTPNPDSVVAAPGTATSRPAAITGAQTPPSSPNNVEKNPSSKKKFPLKYLLGGLFLLLLLVGGGAGLYLMRMSQDVRQQAYGGGCSSAGATQCVAGKKEVCDGSTWRPTNETCTDGVTCSSSGMKPTDTGKACCSGLSVDATGRCMAVPSTPAPATVVCKNGGDNCCKSANGCSGFRRI